jgi:hypothetical protein
MLSRTVESVLKSEPAASAKQLRALLGLRAGVRLESVLRARGGLPHAAAALLAGGTAQRRPRAVCRLRYTVIASADGGEAAKVI